MKILNILFSNNRGGLERNHIDYIKLLKINNHEVEVVTSNGNQYKKEIDELGVKTHYLNNNYDFLDIPLIINLRSVIKKTKPDLIIAHGKKTIILSRIASISLCPIIGVSHDDKIKNLLGCDSVIVVNSKIKKEIEKNNPKKQNMVYVLPQAIEIPEKLPVKKRAGKEIIIGTMGRLSLEKGFVYLIEAIRILKEKDDNIRLIIAGKGSDENDIKTLIDKNLLHTKIEFLGWIEDKKELFSKIDIFCLPAIKENFGIVLLEAALHKKPIISTDTDGPLDIFKHKKTAYLVKKGHNLKNFPRKLARAIETLKNDKELRDSLNKQGFQHVISNYSSESVAKRLDKIVKSVVQRKKSIKSR